MQNILGFQATGLKFIDFRQIVQNFPETYRIELDFLEIILIIILVLVFSPDEEASEN